MLGNLKLVSGKMFSRRLVAGRQDVGKELELGIDDTNKNLSHFF
jgi:hypothetical protein